MDNQNNLRYADEDFESYVSNGLGVIKIKKNVFEIVTDIPESSKFLDTLDSFENDHNISSIIMVNNKGCLGNEEYKRYLTSIFKSEDNEGKQTHINSMQRMTRTRQIVILNNIIKKIIHSTKFFVSALNGEIVTPFWGISLAMDLRIASSNVSFILSHIEMDLHPSGALPYFLPKYLGLAKSSSILYGREKLTLDEAQKWGLVSEIFPEANFEESVKKYVREKISLGKNVLSCTKRLLNSNFFDLENYLNLEECEFQQK